MVLKIVKLYNSKRYFLIDPEKDILIAAKQSLRECIDEFKLVYRGKLPSEHLDMIKKYGDYLFKDVLFEKEYNSIDELIYDNLQELI